MVGIFIRLVRNVGLGVYWGVMAWLVIGVFVVVVSILYNFDYINTDGIGINYQQFVGWIFN